jgi:hypothetical protein
MEVVSDDKIRELAQRWALLHKLEKNRDKMDGVFKGLSESDQRRVYLCGQRISGGLSPKVLPPSENRKETNEQGKKQRRSTAATSRGAGRHKK